MSIGGPHEVLPSHGVSPASERSRFARIIDKDEAVADNYSRVIWKLLSEQFTDSYKKWGNYIPSYPKQPPRVEYVVPFR